MHPLQNCPWSACLSNCRCVKEPYIWSSRVNFQTWYQTILSWILDWNAFKKNENISSCSKVLSSFYVNFHPTQNFSLVESCNEESFIFPSLLNFPPQKIKKIYNLSRECWAVWVQREKEKRKKLSDPRTKLLFGRSSPKMLLSLLIAMFASMPARLEGEMRTKVPHWREISVERGFFDALMIERRNPEENRTQLTWWVYIRSSMHM